MTTERDKGLTGAVTDTAQAAAQTAGAVGSTVGSTVGPPIDDSLHICARKLTPVTRRDTRQIRHASLNAGRDRTLAMTFDTMTARA